MESSEDDKKGYKVKYRKNSARSSLKRPIFCPVEDCRQLTSDPLDNWALDNHGICNLCWIMKVENREKPLIDTQFYRKRLEERGY